MSWELFWGVIRYGAAVGLGGYLTYITFIIERKDEIYNEGYDMGKLTAREDTHEMQKV